MRVSRRVCLSLLMTMAIAGCHRHERAPVDPLAVPSNIVDLALPSSLASDHPAPALRVYVTRSELLVGRKTVARLPADPEHGFDASLKRSGRRNDLLVVPLRDALTNDKQALVYVDRDTRYRIITEVLFTLGQSNVDRWYLATTSASSSVAAQEVTIPDPCARPALRSLDTLEVPSLSGSLLTDAGSGALPGLSSAPLPPPAAAPSSTCPPFDWSTPRLNAAVFVVADGFSIKATGGNIAPGCQDVGAGIAVPLANGKYDFGALTNCLRRVKEATPEFASETRITVAASPATTAQVIVDTMDATRGGDAGVLFTDVSLGFVP